jgi:hypothetical protein
VGFALLRHVRHNHSWPFALTLAVVVQSALPRAWADVNSEASALLRVRSTTQFTAVRVVADESEYRVEGLLHDEQNMPVANAPIRVHSGVKHRQCSGKSSTTNASGQFCFQLTSVAKQLTLTFAGNVHFDPSTWTGAIDHTTPEPAVTLQTSSEWFVGHPGNNVRVYVDHAPSGNSQVQLRVSRNDEPPFLGLIATLERREDAPGHAATFDIGPTSLPPAGPLRVEAVLVSGETELAKVTQTVDLIALVHLVAGDLPKQVRSGQTFTLDVSLEGDGAPIDSGWVEIQQDQRPLAMEPVTAGRASVSLRLDGSREHVTELQIQYVPETPWYRANPPVSTELTVLGPVPWLHIPWAVLALGAGIWVLRSWRRPARSLVRTVFTSDAPRTARITTTSEPTRSWRGRVRDAHTLDPLADVHVALYVPSLLTTGPIRETRTNAFGEFTLGELTPLPEGTKITFTSRNHSTLSQLAPAPCGMEVDLVERRRTLLTAFLDWARPLTRENEPTPQHAADAARRLSDAQAESWALQIDQAVYGPVPPDGQIEQQLLAQRPTSAQSPAKDR